MKALRCRRCGDVIGSMRAPTRDELQALAAGTAFAAIAGMLPADVTETIADVLVVYCVAHTFLGEGNGSEGEDGEKGEDGSGEEADHPAREVEERRRIGYFPDAG